MENTRSEVDALIAAAGRNAEAKRPQGIATLDDIYDKLCGIHAMVRFFTIFFVVSLIVGLLASLVSRL
jgi:hypothetical protein